MARSELWRCWIVAVVGAAWLVAKATPADAAEFRQATGVKVGEVTTSSARVWMRRTLNSSRNAEGREFRGSPGSGYQPLPADTSPDDFEGAVPGIAGRVRIRWSEQPDLSDARHSDWVAVTEATDYSHKFDLTGLKPDTTYYFAAETAPAEGEPADAPLTGSFTTPPPTEQRVPVTFTVVTGMMYKDLDHADGFHIYRSMLEWKPQFLVPTGDTVYYDNELPRAISVPLARYHWNRMYGLPRHIEFHRYVPAYWEKDDHDTYDNDCWPKRNSRIMLPLTYAQGQQVTTEQVPVGDSWYRRVRWGKGLEVWLLEVRDFRSPNSMPDGPEKTILGAEQKQWLKETLAASDADWRVIVSPTPMVGPDRGRKADNHANEAFTHEGDELRQWIQEHGHGKVFVCCGDRHWQYHSVHPTSGVQEFSCGPASDKHAGGSPGLDKEYHRFHRVKGGFLSVNVVPQGDSSQLTFRFHDVNGEVVYAFSPPQPAR